MPHYDIGIIGGGLAGLSLAIQAANAGLSVMLVEKEKYPFHKVCGEYISLESWNFLESLGLPLSQMNLPIIKNLTISAPNGNAVKTKLAMGGFGISRFTIDNNLKNIAIEKGANILENCKAENVAYNNEVFTISTTTFNFTCKVCCGSFGKKSNIDVKWNRNFILQKASALNNYIGVKYHATINLPKDEIALHNFKDGYCGVSAIEDGKYCICYLTTANNLKKSNNSIAIMEEQILQQNPYLKHLLSNAIINYEKPITISQISFAKKTLVENHVLLLGDAAGMIAPLCGNGMSMALHASKIAFEKINLFVSNKITRTQMEKCYEEEWKRNFSSRLKVGRSIQQFFGKKWVTNVLIAVVKKSNWLTQKLISSTHGKPF